MTHVELDPAMLVSAVRYALGRATYIVRVTVDETIRVWPSVPERDRAVIRRDVSEGLASDRAGMEIDRAEWQRLLDATAPAHDFADDYSGCCLCGAMAASEPCEAPDARDGA